MNRKRSRIMNHNIKLSKFNKVKQDPIFVSSKPYYFMLIVEIDTPYKEEIKYWVKLSAVEILDCFETWMFDFDFKFCIYQFDICNSIDITHKLSKAASLYDKTKDIDELMENILNAQDIAEKVDSKYSNMKFCFTRLLYIPSVLHICIDCDLFTSYNMSCKCKKKLRIINIQK